MKKAIFPGTFDPITFGHIDIIQRGLKLFDTLTIAVADNIDKVTLFSLEERVQLIQKVFKNHSKIKVLPLTGLLVDFTKKQKATVIIRGLRLASDFDYEMQMACMNHLMNDHIETVFLPPTEKHIYIASSLVRTIALKHGDPSPFVPKIVTQAIKKKIG